MTEEKKKKTTKATDLQIYVGQDKMSLAKSVADQVTMLSMPTPQKYIMQRKGRGNLLLDYVETNYVVGLLNAIFKFDWDCEIIEQIVNVDEGQIAMKVRLSVRFADGKIVTKTAWGGSEIKRLTSTKKMMDFANDLKAAESDGIKKAASMIGVCWDVYSGLTPSGKKSKVFADSKKSNGLTEPPESPDNKNQFRTIPIKIGTKTYLHTKYEVLDRFKEAKKKLGDEIYYKVLGANGYEKADQVPQDDIQKLYDAMVEEYKANKTPKIEPKKEPEEKDIVVAPPETVDENLTNKLILTEDEAKDNSLGFTAEEVEREQEEPEFPPIKKPEEKEKPEMPLRREIISLTSLEADLVSKHGFKTAQICDQLKEMFGEDEAMKLTRKQTNEAREFFRTTMDALNKAKEEAK